MGHVEADDEFRKQNPEVVDQLHKTEEKTGTINLLRSAGPVSDAFILNTHGISVICGPVGRQDDRQREERGWSRPKGFSRCGRGAQLQARHVAQKYDNHWKATIPSHWKIFRKDLPVRNGRAPARARRSTSCGSRTASARSA
jgi:hypothetical protein